MSNRRPLAECGTTDAGRSASRKRRGPRLVASQPEAVTPSTVGDGPTATQAELRFPS